MFVSVVSTHHIGGVPQRVVIVDVASSAVTGVVVWRATTHAHVRECRLRVKQRMRVVRRVFSQSTRRPCEYGHNPARRRHGKNAFRRCTACDPAKPLCAFSTRERNTYVTRLRPRCVIRKNVFVKRMWYTPYVVYDDTDTCHPFFDALASKNVPSL